MSNTPVASAPASLPIVSPWENTDLGRVVWNEIFGVDVKRPPSRTDAMKLPPLARGRNSIVSAICRIPLREYDQDTATLVQPEWLYATDFDSPVFRIAWTVDDLIFYGFNVWARINNPDGSLARSYRLNKSRWTIDSDGQVWVDGVQVEDLTSIIVIPGLHEGILNFGQAIADARDLYDGVRRRLSNLLPSINLHQVEGEPLTNDEIDKLVAGWVKARNDQNGAVSFTNKGIELKPIETSSTEQLMIEARNAAAVDLARMIGVSASTVDATAPKASLNYETTTGRNQEFVDFDLQLYMTPIAARLSMDDVVPTGQHVAFDLTDFTAPAPAPAGPTLED